MKYIKLYENIDWDWVEEENDNKLNIKVYELNFDEFNDLIKRLKIGDRYLFDVIIKNEEYNNIKGEIKYLNRFIGIEFDEYVNGHDGNGIGKKGIVGFFNIHKLIN